MRYSGFDCQDCFGGPELNTFSWPGPQTFTAPITGNKIRARRTFISDDRVNCHGTDCTCETSTSDREIDCDHKVFVINRCPREFASDCFQDFPELLQCLESGPIEESISNACVNNMCDCLDTDQCGCCCE